MYDPQLPDWHEDNTIRRCCSVTKKYVRLVVWTCGLCLHVGSWSTEEEGEEGEKKRKAGITNSSRDEVRFAQVTTSVNEKARVPIQSLLI